MNNYLKYSDENDRALGLSGMALALYAFDGYKYISALSLDNATGEGVELTPDFYVVSNPRMSAKIVWRGLLNTYELTTAMLIANAMCRAYLGHSRPMDGETSRKIKDVCRRQGQDMCELDADEVERIYSNIYLQLDNMFTHTTVANVARSVSRRLAQVRRLTAAEVMDLLGVLR